jgi:DNA adenine methylase
MTTHVRSPVPWVGGKHAMAPFILNVFPPHEAYDLYCEPFMGACHVIAAKPIWRHYEVINDLNGDLVNFWLQLRDHPEALVSRLDTLPYSRALYYEYHRRLFDGTLHDPLERAVYWFYVLQASFSAWLRPVPVGWKNAPKSPGNGQPHSYHAALSLFAAVSQRLRYVEIDNRDFEAMITQHQNPRTLFYVDPPYLGVEDYYRRKDGCFTLADHERLAGILNATSALVVLSYYDHPRLSQWYPQRKWRRVEWSTVKHSQRQKETRDRVTELLLCNYPAQLSTPSLWDMTEAF